MLTLSPADNRKPIGAGDTHHTCAIEDGKQVKNSAAAAKE